MNEQLSQLLQKDKEFTLDSSIIDDEEVLWPIDIEPDDPYVGMENVLLNFDYPIMNLLEIPYKYQASDSFVYSVDDYNTVHENDDPPSNVKAMKSVSYKLKYPDIYNLRYDTVNNNTYLTLVLTPADRNDGYIGFHDSAQILLQTYNVDYNVNNTDINVPEPQTNPNNVVFDPLPILPEIVSSMSMVRSRDITFQPPFYSVDFKANINVAREITVTPSQFPYNFSIADYNTAYNTSYVGVRRLIVNGNNPLPTQTKSVTYNQDGVYSVVPDTGYTLSQVDVTVSSTPSRIEICGVRNGSSGSIVHLSSAVSVSDGNTFSSGGLFKAVNANQNRYVYVAAGCSLIAIYINNNASITPNSIIIKPVCDNSSGSSSKYCQYASGYGQSNTGYYYCISGSPNIYYYLFDSNDDEIAYVYVSSNQINNNKYLDYH